MYFLKLQNLKIMEKLSKNIDDLDPGSRVKIDDNKKSFGDFVLWEVIKKKTNHHGNLLGVKGAPVGTLSVQQ